MINPYGWRWRTVTRPAILRRAGGVFDEAGRYEGGARCMRCAIPDIYSLSLWSRSTLDCAHLNGDLGDESDENTAALCRPCHRANDYASWAAQYRAWVIAQRERRAAEKDLDRPILALLHNLMQQGLAVQRAAVQILEESSCETSSGICPAWGMEGRRNDARRTPGVG